MAIKAISQFDAAIPTSNDKILFEQNGEGKSATLADLPVSKKTQDALNTKVNTANVLTLGEIQQATTDLTGKVASASSVKSLDTNKMTFYTATSDTDYRDGSSIGIFIDSSGAAPVGHIIFNIAWIKMQFQVRDDAIFVRFKYGGSDASGWKLLMSK